MIRQNRAVLVLAVVAVLALAAVPVRAITGTWVRAGETVYGPGTFTPDPPAEWKVSGNGGSLHQMIWNMPDRSKPMYQVDATFEWEAPPERITVVEGKTNTLSLSGKCAWSVNTWKNFVHLEYGLRYEDAHFTYILAYPQCNHPGPDKAEDRRTIPVYVGNSTRKKMLIEAKLTAHPSGEYFVHYWYQWTTNALPPLPPQGGGNSPTATNAPVSRWTWAPRSR